jgi:chlorite dismutase
MEEQSPRTLNHFALFRFTDDYWKLAEAGKASFRMGLLQGLRSSAKHVDLYQNTDSRADLLVWCAEPMNDPGEAAAFFERLAKATGPRRQLIQLVDGLWGFTRPSQYSRARSAQEIDPFAAERMRYLVMYPFTKTAEWYLLSPEARQGMMNEHIRIGKQYTDIKQLLLYSFGLQDQEFVVVYETDDLPRFSELVNELRDTEARRFTMKDSPVYTAIYHSPEETLALW